MDDQLYCYRKPVTWREAIVATLVIALIILALSSL